MDLFSYEVKIPKERVAVLIGKQGETKQKLEEETSSSIEVDSKEGHVTLKGKEALNLYIAREIIRAVARGFNPEIALRLLHQDYTLEFINLKEQAGDSKNALLRIKGRIIGKEGKTRDFIEQMTETRVCVYGKTVGFIGTAEHVSVARKAVASLIKGSPHSSVYKWLEKNRKELKHREFMRHDEFKEQVKDKEEYEEFKGL